MARTKNKVVKTRHKTNKSTSNSGENNNQGGWSSSPSREGDPNHNSGGVVWVDSSSVKLINDHEGNTANQPDELDEAISISSMLNVTPRLASSLKHFNKHLMWTYLIEHACHKAEVVLHNNAEAKVE